MIARLKKRWRYRGVYPEVGENGWQIGVRFPEGISEKRRHRIMQDLGMSADVFGFDAYSHMSHEDQRNV